MEKDLEKRMGSTNLKEDGRLFDILQKFAIGLLMVMVTWNWNEMSKLDQRVFDLQRSSVTVEGVQLIEDRLTRQLDAVRLDVRSETQALRAEMNSKLDLIIRINTEKPNR